MSNFEILQGDVLEVLKQYPDNHFHGLFCDPPYGLGKQPDAVEMLKAWMNDEHYQSGKTGFMNKEWDSFVPGPRVWKEIYRVLKPGAHGLVFAGSRTYDLMGLSLRLAGFELRDTCMFLYGSGFPKSANISKHIDRMAGVEREVIGKKPNIHSMGKMKMHEGYYRPWIDKEGANEKYMSLTASATSEAKIWDGYGSALKPAFEPLILIRKPLEGTIAENCLKHGCGGINVDGCRIGLNGNDGVPRFNHRKEKSTNCYGDGKNGSNRTGEIDKTTGRFPANLLLDEESVEMLDEQTGELGNGFRPNNKGVLRKGSSGTYQYGKFNERELGENYNDIGGASRFFKCVENNNIGENICGNILENQMEDGIVNGVLKEIEKFIQKVDLYIDGKNKMENFQKDAKFITSILIKQMIDLKIYSVYPKKIIYSYMEDIGNIIKLLTELNIENVKNVKNIKLLITFKREVQELIKDIVKIVKELQVESGEKKIEIGGMNIIENIEEKNRFFYTSKVSSRERNEGLDNMPDIQKYVAGNYSQSPTCVTCDKTLNGINDHSECNGEVYYKDMGEKGIVKNDHPTLKPISLTEYMAKLILPPEGIDERLLLTPFAGTGSEMAGGLRAGWDKVVGIEQDEHYVEIAKKRIPALVALVIDKAKKLVKKKEVVKTEVDNIEVEEKVENTQYTKRKLF